MDSKGEVYNYCVRTFNLNGIAITEDIQNLEGISTFNVKYEYRPQADSAWLEQLAYYNGILKEIRYRENVRTSELLK